jgi:peptidoglycan/LPS O-acetylase OafA/YrhL
MNPSTSLYLELVRFSAAMAVFVSHISGHRFTGGLFWQTGGYGDEGVDVFFVLSGFVIAYVTTRETDARSFAVARLARVYSVALPALAVTIVLDAFGRWLHPEYYAAWWGYQTENWTRDFTANLLFLGHLWWLNIGPGSNLPYWSLTYEVWYYLIFGLFLFAGRYRLWCAAAAALVAGPNILALFPLWLLGVAAFHVCRAQHITPRIGAVLLGGTFVAWIASEVIANRYDLRHIGPSVWVHRDQLPHDYAIGLLFAAQLIGFVAVSHLVSLERFAAPIRWLAGATFTIYLFHWPIAQCLTTIVPWPPAAWQTRVVMFPVLLLILFIIASVTERRKDWWRALFGRLLVQSSTAEPVAKPRTASLP